MNFALLTLSERLANLAHKGQFRRDGETPYINHPKAVVLRLLKDKGHTDEQLAIAWLHDVIEDGCIDGVWESRDVLAQWLAKEGIPAKIIRGVQTLTHLKNESYVDYLERIRDRELVKPVKIADMLCNLADDPTPAQIVKYSKGLLFLLGHAERRIFD